jgi:phospholipid/cholesterol/gamma-HCH transport system permease protein
MRSVVATVTTLVLDPRRLVGKYSLRAMEHVGRVALFSLETARAFKEWRTWVPIAFEQGRHVGVGSLFIVLLTAAFAGAVTALQAGYQFTASLPVYIVGGLVVQTVILELGPVLTALLLAGRIGARYAAELGTMRVTEQIDALESLGRSPMSHLILPRVVAGTVMLPVLIIFADLIGILSGWWFTKTGSLQISTADFIYGARYFFRPWDIWYSMTKALFFGLAISVIPCYVGFTTTQGAQGVGRATTSAVVSASVLILFLDAILAQILLPNA